MTLMLDEAARDALVRYLVHRPYVEVAQLVQLLLSLPEAPHEAVLAREAKHG